MKSAVKAVALFTLFGAMLVHAQSVPLQFQHVIIVIQENRTPDNLFAGVLPQNGWQGPWFENGVDLAIAPTAPQDQGGQPGQQWCLGACFDPGHGNSSWRRQHTNGLPIQIKDPGHCGSTSSITKCNNQPVCGFWGSTWQGCTGQGTPLTLPAWPEESYVGYTLDMNGTQHVLDPYVQIATQYGFGNYFYQTNQGPSQPAHYFLFGGTAAPTGVVGQNNYYNYFQAGNDGSGCEEAATHTTPMINPDGNLKDRYYNNNQPVNINPCFEHQTMADLLMSAGLTWKYYINGNGIWDAPLSIQHICLAPGTPIGNPCNSTYFANVQKTKYFFADFPMGPGLLTAPTGTCSLPNVAWIIPDGKNSDHPNINGGSSTSKEGGPNWVASIVNAVANTGCYDMVNGQKVSYQDDTVIFVLWDDWGGWYDHVQDVVSGVPFREPYEDNYLQEGVNGNPPTCIPSYIYNGTQYWGCGYTYGFRVPFLVVSAYTPAGTVSGGCTQNADCWPPYGDGSQNAAPHQHDFGSILAFIEYNFNLGVGCINSPEDVRYPYNSCPYNIGQGGIPFADYWAPEVQSGYVPLGDFFPAQASLGLAPITLVNNSFDLNYFANFDGPFEDPDDDMIDPQN